MLIRLKMNTTGYLALATFSEIQLTTLPLSLKLGSGSKPLSVRRFRLTAFNYASHPFLSVPSTELFGLAAVGVLVSASIGKPPPCGFIVLPSRFVASAEPAFPDTRLASDHLHLCRGDFPQCRTLSAVLLIPFCKPKECNINPCTGKNSLL